MITQEDLDLTTSYMEKQGYKLGETFGFELSPIDGPAEGLCSSPEPLSRLWYIPSDPCWEGEVMRPWLETFINASVKGDMKMSLNFTI